MKYILTVFIFLFICIGLKAQTKNNPKPMTAQDSTALFNKEYNSFLDSLVTKTSIRSFYEFLESTITVKQWQEGKWVDLYIFFLQTKGNEWMQKKKKP